MADPAPFSNVPSTNDIATNRKLALALMGQATDTSPVGHWTQALARAIQGGVGGMHQAAATQGEKSRQDALAQALAGSGTFGGLNASDQAILAQNPEVMQSVAAKSIGNRLDPNAGLNRQILEQKLKNLQGGGPQDFGKQGAIFQGPDNKFYSIQFGSRGERIIKPVETDGQPLSPAKGVFQVGDELVNKATGQGVRNVAPQIANKEIAEGEGKNIAKVRAELPETRQRLQLIGGALDRLKETALSVRGHKGIDRVVGGLYQAYAPNVSQEALNAGTELENLKVKISGVVLQAMRDASKTGGAVGQVTEREWPRLENMIANLDPKQGKQQFLRNLAGVITYADEVKAALRQAYEADLKVAQRGAGVLSGSPAPVAQPSSGQGGWSARKLD